MKRGCHYIDEKGVQCGKASRLHGYVLSGPDDGDLISHPVLAAGPRDWAERVSERWRFIQANGLAALAARDIRDRALRLRDGA